MKVAQSHLLGQESANTFAPAKPLTTPLQTSTMPNLFCTDAAVALYALNWNKYVGSNTGGNGRERKGGGIKFFVYEQNKTKTKQKKKKKV